MSKELEIQIRKEKARKLRYKHAILPGMNIEDIRSWAYDAREACSEYEYADTNNYEELVDKLDGDEEEALSYRDAFVTLTADLDQLLNNLDQEWVPDCFDDMMVGISGGYDAPMCGFDAFEGDYFGLEVSWEKKAAMDEAKERLKRMKKDDLIDAAGRCIRVALSYMALSHRVDDLQAAAEIVRGLNNGLLRDVQAVDKAYTELIEADFMNQYDRERKFDKLVGNLPQDVWVR